MGGPLSTPLLGLMRLYQMIKLLRATAGTMAL
jgi:hypothetical protein